MVILAKVSRNEFKHILHPNAVLPVRVNKQVISPSIVSTVLAFFFLYIIIIIVSILIMMGMGIGAEESIGCVVSTSVIWVPDWVTPVRHIHGMPCRCGQMVTVIPHVIGASGIVHRLTFVHPGILETELI